MQAQGTAPPSPLRISRGGVLVIQGFAAALGVEGSHLRIRSGTGRRIAEATFSRVTVPRLRRILLIGGRTGGYITLPAIQFCHDIDADLAILSPAGEALLVSGRLGLDDARLRAAQVLASAGSEHGLIICRRLIVEQIIARRQLLLHHFPDATKAATALEALVSDVSVAPSFEHLRTLEASGAATYWRCWEHRVAVRWARRDEARVPERWKSYPGRGSPLANGPRMSADPINSCLNLAAALLELATILALRGAGLDHGIPFGRLHSPQKARASAAADAMEPARWRAEELVLELVENAVLSRRQFLEGRSGHVVIAPPFAKSLVETWLPELERAVAPWAEWIAAELGKAIGVDTPTRLTESRRSAGRDPYRKAAQRTRTRKRVADRMVPNACRECGKILRSRTRLLCDACAALQRVESAQQVGRATLSAMRVRGVDDPARTPEARAKLGTAQETRARERAEWKRAHPGETPDPAIFRAEILQGLAGVSVERIARATGLSTAHAWRIRKGERVPHPRFWGTLAALAGEAEAKG